jgi:hypothetical protein
MGDHLPRDQALDRGYGSAPDAAHRFSWGYHRLAVRAFRLRGLWLVVLSLAGSQAGHLLVYELRFGARAASVQSSGAHTYFPPLAGGLIAAAGIALILALLVIGAARGLAGALAARRAVRPALLDLLALLFTLQLAIFVAQEFIEAAQAGLPFAPVTLVWGITGQLAAAGAGALALSLVLTRFETALDALLKVGAATWPDLRVAVEQALTPIENGRRRAQARPGGLGSRAPPG